VINLKVLKLTDKAFEMYRKHVKGNQNTSRDQAALKLTRNVLLAKEIPPRNTVERLIGNKLYAYGNLHILVRRGKVVNVFNHYGGEYHDGWQFDKQKYIELTKQLGIEDSKF
jgi:hypothetical protein